MGFQTYQYPWAFRVAIMELDTSLRVNLGRQGYQVSWWPFRVARPLEVIFTLDFNLCGLVSAALHSRT